MAFGVHTKIVFFDDLVYVCSPSLTRCLSSFLTDFVLWSGSLCVHFCMAVLWLEWGLVFVVFLLVMVSCYDKLLIRSVSSGVLVLCYWLERILGYALSVCWIPIASLVVDLLVELVI